MCILSFILGMLEEDDKKKNKSKNVSGYSESELSTWGLDEWEKEEVRKGNADPWEFTDEDDDEEF